MVPRYLTQFEYNNSRFEMLLLKKTKPRKGNKSKNKKQRTFTSSEFSLPEEKQLSLNELFRNDLLKRKAMPKVNQKSQKQLGSTKKRTKSKSKCRLDKCETYEVIPYKNSLNSEIVFSNEDTKRERALEDTMSEQVAIRVNQQYLLDSNRQLRVSIKKEYHKKVEAAVKIQKVFRGYLTRKILLKYVQQEHRLLSERLGHHHSESVSQHSSYFAEKEQNSKRRVVSEQQAGILEYENHRDNEEEEEDEQEESEEESDDDINTALYRHHEPIYLNAEDSENLFSDEEQDFNSNTYFPIMEVAAEYIDSRKSSGLESEPRNKLSRPSQPQIEAIDEQEPPLTPNNPTECDHRSYSKTEKKGEKERIKPSLCDEDEIREETVKLSDEVQELPNGIPYFLKTIENAALKEKDSLVKKQQEISLELEAGNLSRLKQTEMVRWSEIIELVQSQIIKSGTDNDNLNDCMQKIMNMSMKNKEMLELVPDQQELNSSQSSSLYMETSIPKIGSRSKLKHIKADRVYLQDSLDKQEEFQEEQAFDIEQHLQSIRAVKEEDKYKDSVQPERKKESIVLSDKTFFFDSCQSQKQSEEKGSDVPVNFHSPVSSFENTGQMKKFLAGNIQDEHIEEMLKLREDTLRKREFNEMKEANVERENKTISEQIFMFKVETITLKYSEEKMSIEKTKEDISKGHQAALKLTKQAFHDAKKLGYNLPISRSLEGLKYKSPLILGDIIIDELVQVKREVAQHKPFNHMMLGEQSDHESSDLQFTQEELQRFRRAQPYDIELAEEIADMGRNVMISEELFRQQQQGDEDENILMKTQHVHRQLYEIESASPHKNDPQLQSLTETIFQNIIYELTGELLIKPLFSEKLIDKNHFFKPKSVSDQERLKFIELLQQHFPKELELNLKLNQKICPLPTELLRCMRIDFNEEDDDDNSYEEIGKYEFIIGQEICNQAIKDFLKEVEGEGVHCKPALEKLGQLAKEYSFNDRVFKYVEQREKYIANRKNHTKELRWEVLNIEIHCIFDAWNEELIYLRSQKAGYSGIGLNQLTLSIKDHNCLVPIDETVEIIKEGKERLINNLGQSSPGLIFPRVIEEDEGDQLEQDSRWIFYADQALSYGLQLVYLIQEQIFSQMGKELSKTMFRLFHNKAY